MNKKYTYKPTSSVKYSKGGKNKKKSYKSDGKQYKAQDGGFLSFLTEPIANLFGIGNMMDFLGMEDVTAGDFESIYQMGIDQQADAAETGTGLAGEVGIGTGFSSTIDPTTGLSNLQSVNRLQDQIDNIGIARPKKTSTEFLEGVKDTIGQQTTGVIRDIGKTGKMTGIKDILEAGDTSLTGAMEKAAGMDERYQQQLTDIEKFETGQETSLVTQQANQEFGADQAAFDLAGDLTAQSAQAGGDLAASAIAGLVELQGQQAAATADLIGGAFDTILGFFNPFDDFGIGSGEDGMMVATKDKKENSKKEVMKAEKGAKMQEYEEGAKQDMMPSDEADVTPGKFSHEDNPIDIVQDGEKIGEMTGGEAIMPPKDVAEFEDLLAEGDKNAVFNKLKILFAKWERKAQEHKEKNLDQNAMGGAKMVYRPKTTLKYN
tara:strand:+ start:156 stop:1451 length:1296 start_codon:yes stop_codon:yes gene_type:complete